MSFLPLILTQVIQKRPRRVNRPLFPSTSLAVTTASSRTYPVLRFSGSTQTTSARNWKWHAHPHNCTTWFAKAGVKHRLSQNVRSPGESVRRCAYTRAIIVFLDILYSYKRACNPMLSYSGRSPSTTALLTRRTDLVTL